MSDTTKRDAVLREFMPCGGYVCIGCEVQCSNVDGRIPNTEDMADEIVLLRKRLTAVEAERDGYMHTCTEWVQAQLKWNEEFCGVRARADRAERILAALREPSEAVLAVICAEMGAISDHYLPTSVTTLIRAAVAAAEQEVHDGEYHPNTLVALLREAADEIEGSVRHEYGWPDVHPARKLKFDRDMDIVTRLRSAAAEQEVGA